MTIKELKEILATIPIKYQNYEIIIHNRFGEELTIDKLHLSDYYKTLWIIEGSEEKEEPLGGFPVENWNVADYVPWNDQYT